MWKMDKWILLLVAVLAAGCASGPRIDTTYSAVSHRNRIQFLVLHYTVLDYPESLRVLTQQPVSSHYLVRDDPPTIHQLVDESRSAFHAGLSSWQGRTYLNEVSIGIEIVNDGWKQTPQGIAWAPFPKAQMDVVIELVKSIVKRHEIRPDRIVGHSDIAPLRKEDPGPLFPWKRLADEGLIDWPDAAKVAGRLPAYDRELPDIDWFQQRLFRHGFEVPRNGQLDQATVRVISAFQMKYRPAKYDGFPDAETAAILDVMTDR